MWAHRPWIGRWFPASTPAREELAVYATWCTTVEGNTTHYAPPTPETVRRWSDLAPSGFRFCFKLPRSVTHERRLRHCEEEVTDFLALLEPLHDRLGPVQIQLPASFGPDALDQLAAFCRGLPRSVDWALETRHAEFAAGGSHERGLNDALADSGINRVLMDSRTLFSVDPVTPEERETWERKPRLPVRPVATGTQPLIRFIGTSDPDRTRAGWQPWLPKVVQWCGAGLEPHVFIHTPDNEDSPMLARQFWDDAAGLLPTLDPLPPPERAAEQMGLFRS